VNITVSNLESATGALRAQIAALSGSGLADLHLSMITEVQHVTEAHLWQLAAVKHATAERLGAGPSGHLAEAATKVAQTVPESSASEGSLSINHPGMGRAFHDVTITKPGGMIAIPLCALAYARKPSQLWDGSFFMQRVKGKLYIFKKVAGAKPLALYLLVRSVTQKQDRSLLPSDDHWADAALSGARYFLRRGMAAAA
jgi:hypothetical protein